MKEFLSLLLVALLAIIGLSSCSKDTTIDPYMFDQVAQQEAPAAIFSVDLQFDAPADMNTATVEFYDENGQEVAVVTVPSVDIQKVTFVSESKPAALYTPGLQNVNSDGVLPIGEANIDTKAGDRPPVLLVIR